MSAGAALFLRAITRGGTGARWGKRASLCRAALSCLQLIINIPFQQKVKLQSIVIKGPADSGPRLVRLWANRGHLVGALPGEGGAGSVPERTALPWGSLQVSLAGTPLPGQTLERAAQASSHALRCVQGFSDVQGTVPASQEFTLTEAQLTSGEPVQLKMVKFATTSTLSIFVEDNQTGADTTKVSKIALLGQPGGGEKTRCGRGVRVALWHAARAHHPHGWPCCPAPCCRARRDL